MEEEILLLGSLSPDIDLDWCAAIDTVRVDMSVGMEGGTNPKCVPGAVGIPVPAAGADAITSRNCREGVRHTDFRSVGLQHQSVRVVQPAPAIRDVVGG